MPPCAELALVGEYRGGLGARHLDNGQHSAVARVVVEARQLALELLQFLLERAELSPGSLDHPSHCIAVACGLEHQVSHCLFFTGWRRSSEEKHLEAAGQFCDSVRFFTPQLVRQGFVFNGKSIGNGSLGRVG